MCWLLYKQNTQTTNKTTKTYKQNTIQTRSFLLRDRKKVSIRILFQNVFLVWKLFPIINRQEVGIRMSWVEKNQKIFSRSGSWGTSIKHPRVIAFCFEISSFSSPGFCFSFISHILQLVCLASKAQFSFTLQVCICNF